MYIKKKLTAISMVLAITASFAACSDKGDSEANKVQPTLSSEEINQIAKHSLSIEPFVAATDVVQDAVENPDGDNNDPAGGNADNNNSAGGNANNNSPAGGNADSNNPAGGNANNNNPAGGNDNVITPGNNNVDISGATGLKVISGTKTLMQAYWMDISQSKDFTFNGEYMTAEFKIKENAQEGIYPITIDWLSFSNWDAKDVEFKGIDGAIVVGDDVDENKFNDSNEPQMMVSNTSGKPGDVVKVSFNIKNNPGVVLCLLRFGYNSDALEYYGGGEGADFNGTFQS